MSNIECKDQQKSQNSKQEIVDNLVYEILSELILLLFIAFPIVFAWILFSIGMIWLIVPFIMIFISIYYWWHKRKKIKQNEK